MLKVALHALLKHLIVLERLRQVSIVLVFEIDEILEKKKLKLMRHYKDCYILFYNSLNAKKQNIII